ncbi:MAG: hypothetical protein NTW86_24395 [Candidatus Sumerlaeota bacterium]|nr:hypothetical protein [Candidatus Sumerlaeota bacterium]
MRPKTTMMKINLKAARGVRKGLLRVLFLTSPRMGVIRLFVCVAAAWLGGCLGLLIGGVVLDHTGITDDSTVGCVVVSFAVAGTVLVAALAYGAFWWLDARRGSLREHKGD